MARVLIVDDDEAMARMLADMVRMIGHEVTCAYTAKEALDCALATACDLVLLDVRLPDGNGLEILPKIRKTVPAPEVIIMTGAGDPDGAELAVRSGAWDYIQKPLSPKKVILLLNGVLRYRDELKNVRRPTVALKTEGIIGSSPQMKACLDALARAADSDANVLICGETGTGKELFARAIHFNSARAKQPFVVVDCAAIPPTLVESLLFGHEKGSFTGAEAAQLGLVRQADGGTLFLDEIGELPPSIQKTFLRVLQERSFRPVGGTQEVQSDFRLVTATNRDLDKMVQEGRFRQDLLFRFQSLRLELPPLREHMGDIKELVLHYTAAICEGNGLGTKGISAEFMEALLGYEWPGNVRELINALEGSITEAMYEPTLFAKHLPELIRVSVARASVRGSPLDVRYPEQQHVRGLSTFPTLEGLIEATERQYLRDLLSSTGGDVKEACRISGLSRSRLYDRLKRYDIKR